MKTDKICAACGFGKLTSEFYQRLGNRDGLRGKCKSCCSLQSAAWRASNSEYKITSDKAYYQREAERLNRESRIRYANDPQYRQRKTAANKAWGDDNKGRISVKNKNWKQQNLEAARVARRQHYRDNKPSYVAAARAREKHIKRATPPWADLAEIEKFYVEADRLTRETGVKHYVDHFYPLRGEMMCGLHVEANLRVIPAAINLSKSNKVEEAVVAPLCCT